MNPIVVIAIVWAVASPVLFVWGLKTNNTKLCIESVIGNVLLFGLVML